MRFVIVLIAVVVAALAVTELTMQPSAADRTALLVIFGAIAGATGLASWLLPRVTNRFRTLRHTVLLVSMAAVAVVAVAVAVSAQLMFLSSHDLRLVVVAVGLGVVLGVLLAATISRPLAEDLGRLAGTARRVGEGDLSTQAGLDRPDEVGTVAVAMDGMIESLRAARLEREQAEVARRAFLAAIGHDLRTPLTSMQAAVEALQDGVVEDPDRYLRSMLADLELLSGLVEDLFLLAQIEAGKLEVRTEPVDLADLADEAVEAMAPVARRRGVEIDIDADHHITVLGGELELGRVIRNLLENAIRHAPDSSHVRVEVGNGGPNATVRIVDEGPGFPEDLDVFESFAKGDAARTRSHGGAGLGLAIAKGLVEAHGGSIAIEPGPGGRVAFRLPVVSN
jgi:two-component system sensor histidine kinase BaeS